MLIGNKNDLETERAVEYSEGKSKADELGIPFFETSAKTASNIEEAFKAIANNILAKINIGEGNAVKRNNNLNLHNEEVEKPSGCRC